MAKSSNSETRQRPRVSFAAIDPFIQSNICEATETLMSRNGHDMVSWGTGNAFPEYLLDLYENVATLRSIINGCVDYVTGNDVTTAKTLWNGAMNRKGELAIDIVRLCAGDYYRYGGFALQIIRNNMGAVSELYYCDLRFLRKNKEGDVFYYSEEWGKKYGRTSDAVVYPAFMPNANHPSSILYVQNTHTQTYPSPLYAASLKACETERSIDTFHLNSINNGFTASYFVNFNNGKPTDAVMEEVEKNFMEKFSGMDNAARIGFSWNKNKDSATTFEKIDVEDFGEKYKSLAEHSRQQIFTAFRANPNLFGIPTESLGFSSEEYESAFRLFNRTQIRPVQNLIIDAFDKVLGMKNSITIVPFSLD